MRLLMRLKYVNMLRFVLLTMLVLSACSSRAQVQNTASDKPPTLASGFKSILDTFQPIYNFRKGEVIASVGAGLGFQEVVYSLMADSLTFYLQDINISGLATQNLESNVQQIYRNAGHTYCNTTFLTYRGTETNTNLPDQTFDKIIAEHSLHEFTHPSEMLQSIRSNLKPGGILFILEQIAKRLNRKYPVCGRTMFTEQSLVTLLDENGFLYVNKMPINSANGGGIVFRFERK
jgi:SAM-dependent methyltransferase